MNYPELFSSHRRKIVIGAPILFLLALNIGMSGGNTFELNTEHSIFATIGDEVPVTLSALTRREVNAMGGTITFTPSVLEAKSVTRGGSIIDLWSEDPTIDTPSGTIHWSGGVVGEHNDGISGKILTMNFQAIRAGKANISLLDGQLLAKNGEGTNVLSGSNNITIYVREAGRPSPDINKDGTLTIGDINSLYLKTFGTFDPTYDLDGNQKVDWGDVTTLVALMRSEPSDRK